MHIYIKIFWKLWVYCNRRNFHTQFNFVFFVLLAESTKFCSIRKPYTYTSVCDTALAIWKFMAYDSPANARVRNFYVCENFCDYSSSMKMGDFLCVKLPCSTEEAVLKMEFLLQDIFIPFDLSFIVEALCSIKLQARLPSKQTVWIFYTMKKIYSCQ